MSNADKSDMVRHLRDHAEALAKAGYVIFPIEPGGKLPLVKWATHSTCNPAVVRDWWEQFPDDNIGINCGPSGIVVVDLDSRQGLLDFNRLWQQHESTDVSQCGAPIIKTRRGWHVYFNSPPGEPIRRGIRNSSGADVDVRADGGMVVAPGSVVSGHEYELIDGDLDHVPQLPAWLHVMLLPRLRKPVNYVTNVPDWYAELQLERWRRRIVDAPDGQQNQIINKAAYVLTAQGVDPALIRSELLAAAELGNHPRHRARPTIESGIAAAQRERKSIGNRE